MTRGTLAIDLVRRSGKQEAWPYIKKLYWFHDSLESSISRLAASFCERGRYPPAGFRSRSQKLTAKTAERRFHVLWLGSGHRSLLLEIDKLVGIKQHQAKGL
jgi:hypothetical protein